jgi:hypothetical protein
MATRRWGVSRGESPEQVTEAVGSAVASDSVELTVDLAVSLTREDVLLAIKKIERQVASGKWPPA